MLPDILKVIARLNPFTYGIDALKHAVLREGVYDFPLYVDVGVLIVLSALFVCVAGLLFERKK
jgi:ABC-2 type transport system permease protein